MKFEELGLSPNLLRAIAEEGYETATPIQAAAIPPVLEGRDVLGCAQTGTGKTAAFALPTLDRLSRAGRPAKGRRPIRALILSPTRELALQISENFRAYGRHTGLRNAVVFGGVGQGPQVRALRDGIDVLIATPGRLLDLKNQGFVDLTQVEVVVLDEADRMLDMGFLPDLKRIVQQIPKTRQTLLFSATMPVNLQNVVNEWLRNPVEVRVNPVSSTVVKIEQSVIFVDQKTKMTTLTDWLHATPWTRALVFSRTKHGADKIARHLLKYGIAAEAFHSNKSQAARQRTLRKFQSHPLVLVATDIAARGLDIDEISHVVNFDMPVDSESYVHRIGRTGRAGSTGVAVSFCSSVERKCLVAIERLTKRKLAVEKHPASSGLMPSEVVETPENQSSESKSGDQRPGQRRFGKPGFGKNSAGNGGGNGGGYKKFGKRPFSKGRRKPAAAQG